jgi:sialic acid synthase SpsE
MSKVFVCLEIGHNHSGNIRLAKLMIEEAKKVGADAVKFQIYDTDTIKKPWQSRYFELKFSEVNREELLELKRQSDKVGIEFMASAFDPERVGWLEDIGVKRHKIASRSINDHELIRSMEKTGKPIIASLGTWKGKEFPKIKNAEFLYCVADYPAYITSDMFPSKFDKYAGFSDHSLGMYWCREAVKRGARIIEKHFTLSKDLPGHDQKGSADPTEMKDFISYVRQAENGIW